jgi:DNA-binding response OmpR family regulator
MNSSLNVLCVEYEDDLRADVVRALQDEGDSVVGVKCAEDATDFTGAFDIAIVDLNLPGEDGLSLVKRLRQIQPSLGVIMLSARNTPEDRTRGYVNGVDVYLSKPANLGELCGAVSALRRRLRPTAPAGVFRLNPHRLRLTSPGGQSVFLSPREADLLVAFCRAPSYRLEQSFMIDLLDKEAASNPKSALELHVLRIRRKIMRLGDVGPGIQSIRGWGYQLCMNVIIE